MPWGQEAPTARIAPGSGDSVSRSCHPGFRISSDLQRVAGISRPLSVAGLELAYQGFQVATDPFSLNSCPGSRLGGSDEDLAPDPAGFSEYRPILHHLQRPE